MTGVIQCLLPLTSVYQKLSKISILSKLDFIKSTMQAIYVIHVLSKHLMVIVLSEVYIILGLGV